MKTGIIGGLLGLGVLAAAVMGGDFFPPPNAKPGTWHTDYHQARELARQSGKPIFLVFRCQP